MAVTNRIHGKNTYFQLDDSTGASRNLSGDGNNVTMSRTIKNLEATAFQDPDIQRTASGLGDIKFTYNAWANSGANANLAVLDGIKGGSTMIVWGPSGSLTGLVKYSACVVMDDYELDTKVEGIMTAKGTFSLASGSLTKGVF